MKPDAYGPFPYSPIIHRPRLTWPGGARVALWVIPNVEFFSLEERPGGFSSGKIPDIPLWSARDYGNRVGVFRIMQVLDRYDICATVALNSDLCSRHPEIIQEGRARNWEWMGHNKSNTRRLNDAAPGEEPKIIHDSLVTIAQATGTRPAGWLGSGLQETWDTLDLLAAEGVEYVCDWCNDDQPYVMSLEGGRSLVSVPYSRDINDKAAFEHDCQTAVEFQEMICRQFDVLYREGAESGRVMAIAVHPYLTGLPYRIDSFDRALEYICGHEGVWRATGREIAHHYMTVANGMSKKRPTEAESRL